MWKLGKEATEFSRLKSRWINSNKLRKPQMADSWRKRKPDLYHRTQVLRINTVTGGMKGRAESKERAVGGS